MEHPYTQLPGTAFWKRAVSSGWNAINVSANLRLIERQDVVASAGSCFASNIVPYLERAGFRYLRIGELSKLFGEMADDNFGYSRFSADYGNIYTVRQAVQLLKRSLGRFAPAEDRWVIENDLIIDPFRPGLRYPAYSEAEFELLTAQHLHDVLDVFRTAQVFIFTLGLTEAWMSAVDGAVFPACPGTIRGEFDPERHVFHNFTCAEVSADLDEFIHLSREINPSLRFILTVSPVPLVATATGDHVLTATTYSKAVLRAAAGEAARRHDNVCYFPAYEIVTGPQAAFDFFEADRREPSTKAIDEVMRAFLARCDRGDIESKPFLDASRERPPAVADNKARDLSQLIAVAACEEAAAGLRPPRLSGLLRRFNALGKAGWNDHRGTTS